MKGGTLFSGIGAPELAMPWVDWRWCAEIDPFATAVLAHHYPDTPNLGDVTKVDWNAVEPVDLIVFGSPCQSFSVAGKRLGLDDPRGNLALYALRVVGLLRPRWMVFENVPGLLSSDGGRDFGAFLGLLGELGYGFAYRILDAQHFGVPQRRRRVFVVGHLGDWRPAAAVLFEPESLRGDPAPRREAGERTPALPSRSSAGGGLGTDFDCDGGLIAFDPRQIHHPANHSSPKPGDPCHPLRGVASCEPAIVTHSLRADGFDASEDGTGRGTPLVAIQNATRGQDQNGLGVGGETMFTLDGASQHAVAFESRYARNGRGKPEPVVPPLKAQSGQSGKGDAAPLVASSMMVRRLMPIECERLMGTPDGYTNIPSYNPHYTGPYGGNRGVADGPRYRALGNSMAVPVVAWIGRQIARVDAAVPRGTENPAR